jgi:hypothetical protein
MIRRFDLVVRLHDLPVGTDQVRDALRVIRPLRIQCAIRLALRLVEAEQLEWIAELLAKLSIRLDAIKARAEDDQVLLLELADSITESVAFDRSTRGISGRIEPEQHVLAGVIGESDGRSVVGLDGEIRRGLPRGEQCHAASLAQRGPATRLS